MSVPVYVRLCAFVAVARSLCLLMTDHVCVSLSLSVCVQGQSSARWH
jgi:hypothetical protein